MTCMHACVGVRTPHTHTYTHTHTQSNYKWAASSRAWVERDTQIREIAPTWATGSTNINRHFLCLSLQLFLIHIQYLHLNNVQPCHFSVLLWLTSRSDRIIPLDSVHACISNCLTGLPSSVVRPVAKHHHYVHWTFQTQVSTPWHNVIRISLLEFTMQSKNTTCVTHEQLLNFEFWYQTCTYVPSSCLLLNKKLKITKNRNEKQFCDASSPQILAQLPLERCTSAERAWARWLYSLPTEHGTVK